MAMQNETQALNAIENVKNLINKRDYKEARASMKAALQLFPNLNDGIKMLIICETLYYGEVEFPNCGVDWYSLLHLHPSASNNKVNTQCAMLILYTTEMLTKLNFPGASDALCLLKQAKFVLCDREERADYDTKRKEKKGYCAEYDRKTMFTGEYMDWKPPPVFRSDVDEQFGLEKRFCEDDGGLILSPRMKKLRNQVFDEMPQRPHYSPLEKYGREVREGMMKGLDIRFINLCEEIRKLEETESFLCRYDGFMEQLMQLEKMGYTIEKLRERLETLKRIAERERAYKAEANKFEGEVKEHETRIVKLKARVLDLEYEIEKSKVLVEKRNFKIDDLKEGSMEAIQEFTSIAKGMWK